MHDLPLRPWLPREDVVEEERDGGDGGGARGGVDGVLEEGEATPEDVRGGVTTYDAIFMML